MHTKSGSISLPYQNTFSFLPSANAGLYQMDQKCGTTRHIANKNTWTSLAQYINSIAVGVDRWR